MCPGLVPDGPLVEAFVWFCYRQWDAGPGGGAQEEFGEPDEEAMSPATPALLSPKQIAEKYPFVSRSLLYLWCEEGLPHLRLGAKNRRGKILIDEQDFLAFLETKKVTSRADDGDWDD
jgi:hypothetical protein